MMKSIAFNDTANPADDEGFVIVDSPQGFSSILEDDDEESYDHCDDAFSFSSLHQNVPVSSLPMETVQDNFFEPPIGQEVLPPAGPSTPSLLSDYDYDDEDDDDDNPAFATENSCQLKVVIPHIDSDVEGLCALVGSLPSVSEPGGALPEDKSAPAPTSTALSTPEPTLLEATTASAIHSSVSSSFSEYPTGLSSEEDDDDDDSNKDASATAMIPSSGSTDEDDDEVASADKEEETSTTTDLHSTTEPTNSRLSKKKRRKQLKLAKKAAAAAAAAAALGHLTLRSTTPKRKGTKNRKKVANIAVSCAVQSIAEYKSEVLKTSKKIR